MTGGAGPGVTNPGSRISPRAPAGRRARSSRPGVRRGAVAVRYCCCAGGLRRLEPDVLEAVGQRPLPGHRGERLGVLLLRLARRPAAGCVRQRGVVSALPVAPPAADRARAPAGHRGGLGLRDRRAGDAGVVLWNGLLRERRTEGVRAARDGRRVSGAVYAHAIFPTSLAQLCMVAAGVALARGRWTLVGLSGGFLSTSYVTGVLLAAPNTVATWLRSRRAPAGD